MRSAHVVVPLVIAMAIATVGAAAVNPCLVVTTHGSVWQYSDVVWRYPAFKVHESSFEVQHTITMDRLLESHAEQTLAAAGSLDVSFELTEQVDDALLFHLSGSSPSYEGMRMSFTVEDPLGVTYRQWNHLSERTLHIDRPVQGTYLIHLYTDSGATFTLDVGVGKSPFMTIDLSRYHALVVPDIDPLSAREIDNLHDYVDAGGKLVVLSDFIQGTRYYTSSNFTALNDLLEPTNIQFTGELLTSTAHVTANTQEINVLNDIRPSRVTSGVTQVVSTGSTLSITGSATGLVFDDAGEPVIALERQGDGEVLVVATGIGFNADFSLSENDLLATRIVEWATDLRSSLFITAAAAAAGMDSTYWSTDAWIHNRTDVVVDVAGAFLAQQKDNSAAVAAPTALGTIQPGGFLEVADIVSTLGSQGKVGGLYLEAVAREATSSADYLRVSSHTWTPNPFGDGTFGQGIPGVTPGEDSEVRASGVFETSSQRTNFGVLNTSNAQLDVRIDILDASGTQRATVTWNLLPYEQSQRSVSSAGISNLVGGSVVFTSTSGSGSFRAYLSIVDNDSGDAVYVEAR